MRGLGDRAAALVGGTLSSWVRIADGNLSAVYRMTMHDGRTMVAKSAATAGQEATMLRALRNSGAPCPAVFGSTKDLLVMESMRTDGTLHGAAWASLADGLRTLHATSADNYGWSADHAFGDVAIPNACSDNWINFWADQRLRCLLPYLEAATANRIEMVADRIGDLLPLHPAPSLLHGDLWNGNILVSGSAVSALIDPACYHGHREVDTAMLTLFSAPPQSFFDALDLEPGWRDRLPVYRLWPALVHLRLFGSSYAGLVSRTLSDLGA